MTVLHCILHALNLAWHALETVGEIACAVSVLAIVVIVIAGLIHDWREQRAKRIDVDQPIDPNQPIDPWPDDLISRLQRAVADEIASQKRSMS